MYCPSAALLHAATHAPRQPFQYVPLVASWALLVDTLPSVASRGTFLGVSQLVTTVKASPRHKFMTVFLFLVTSQNKTPSFLIIQQLRVKGNL